jgi:PadR family transcriptional regulator PadR
MYTDVSCITMVPRPAPGGEGPAATDKWEVQIRKGCLELAILAILWSGRLYGLEILRLLADRSGLVVPEGTVYPLLARLKADGLLAAEWVEGEAGHPRKYYTLTASGRRRALQMARLWSTFSASLDHLLAPLRKGER